MVYWDRDLLENLLTNNNIESRSDDSNNEDSIKLVADLAKSMALYKEIFTNNF